jgi:hypothetical protein
MKKLIYGTLFLALVGIGIVACKKEKSDITEKHQINYQVVSTDGEMLKFATIKDYEAIINAEESVVRERFVKYVNTLNFKNYFTNTNIHSQTNNLEKGQEVQEMDEVLGALLNSDGVLQIENHLYKIDLVKAQVFVIEAVNRSADYNDLIIGNTSNSRVSAYSVNDDVIHIVNGENTEKCTGSSGFEVWNETTDASLKIRATCKLFAGGVIHRVTGRAKKTGTYNGSYVLKVEAGLNNIQIKRKPCNNNEVTFHAMGIKAQATNNVEVVFEAYSKTWSVKNMYMYVRTKAEFFDNTATVYKQTDYTGANF